MALIAVVTPADKNSPTVEAFSEELAGFGWDVQDDSIFDVYSGADPQYNEDISVAASSAVSELDPGGVLVAAGEMAAFYVQQETGKTNPPNQIPIILAFGGQAPSNAAANMIGFLGDCTQVAKNHVKALKHNYTATQITVLYDMENINHVTQNILKALLHDDNTINAQAIDTANIEGQIDALLTTPGFMIIPNAVFFEKADVITSAVDNSDVQIAYYPEYYYYTKSDSRKNKAKVSGFNVPATYRVAASWVNDILRQLQTVATIIQGMSNKQFAEAIEYPYLVPSHPSQPTKSSQRKASTKQSTKRKKGPKQPTQR
jgi:hypothetical protein